MAEILGLEDAAVRAGCEEAHREKRCRRCTQCAGKWYCRHASAVARAMTLQAKGAKRQAVAVSGNPFGLCAGCEAMRDGWRAWQSHPRFRSSTTSDVSEEAEPVRIAMRW